MVDAVVLVDVVAVEVEAFVVAAAEAMFNVTHAGRLVTFPGIVLLPALRLHNHKLDPRHRRENN